MFFSCFCALVVKMNLDKVVTSNLPGATFVFLRGLEPALRSALTFSAFISYLDINQSTQAAAEIRTLNPQISAVLV